jgi:hypothetical protein
MILVIFSFRGSIGMFQKLHSQFLPVPTKVGSSPCDECMPHTVRSSENGLYPCGVHSLRRVPAFAFLDPMACLGEAFIQP